MVKPLRDKALKYYDSKHVYKVGSKKLTSVTQFVHEFFSPFDAKKKARELAALPWAKAQKKGVRYWLGLWKANGEHGTKVHKLIEDIVRADDVIVCEEPKAISALKYLYDAEYEELEPEVRIYSEELGLAGTVDLIATKEGEYTLVDWKTSKEIRKEGFAPNLNPVTKNLPDANYTHYSLQLATYAVMLEKEYGIKVKKLHLVHLLDKKHVVYDIDFSETLKRYVHRMLVASGRIQDE